MGVIFESRAAGHGFAFTASTTREDVKRCDFARDPLRAQPLSFEPPVKITGPRYDAGSRQFHATRAVAEALSAPLNNRTKVRGKFAFHLPV